MLAIAIVLSAAACSLQPAAAQGTSPGSTFKTQDSTADLIPLRVPDAKPAPSSSAAAATAEAPQAAVSGNWWETDGDEDESKCSVTYAGPSRVVGLKSHTTSRACARTCRSCTVCSLQFSEDLLAVS